MVRKLLQTVALAAVLVAGGIGAASATEGWYGRLDAGYSVDGNFDIGDASADLKDDWMESGGVGYAFANGWRLEGEVAHRFNKLDTGGPVDSGKANVWSGMINAYYDFNKGHAIEPYVGAGVGGARVDGRASLFAGNDVFDDSDTVWAWQAMAGVAFRVSPRLDLDVGYRYFRAENASFNGVEDGVVPISAEGDYTHQAVTVGLRWQFAAPPPPPPPPPPPAPVPPPPAPPPPPPVCPTSDFVVYFEWDRSNLNQAALEVIDQAVARARECNVASVVVIGHTDTSGSIAYNLGLSNRRASVVRDALVARGLPTTAITTEGRGETDLAKPTRNGVREPLNRRTAVTISFR